MKKLHLLIVATLCAYQSLHAQNANGVVDSKRSINWSTAGVAGGIPNRTTICTTLGPGATSAQINSAIAACPSGQVVFLSEGTYSIGSPGIIFNDKSNVTLRGAGPDKTIINFSAGNNCGGMGGDVCFINGDANETQNVSNSANWTAGYSRGGTVITLSNTANLKVGTQIILDQLDDPDIDTGSVWNCGKINVCATEGQSGTGRTNRHQQQIVRVVSVSGSNVTIEPGLYMPNWRSAQAPGAWWSNDTPITGSGIESMRLNHSASQSPAGVYFYNAYGCWTRNVHSIQPARNHVWFYQSTHITVRDNYFYSTQVGESNSYGTEDFMTSDNLVENNIFQHIAVPMLSEGGQGGVFAYNFSFDDYYNVADWQQSSSYHHGPGNSFSLWEGNDGTGLTADNVHGTANFITAFRNRWIGKEPTKTLQTVPVHIYTFSRYFNVIGNVLGDNAYHTRYESFPTISTGCNNSIFALGWGGNCESGTIPNDAKVRNTLMRWGNYDTVTDTSRFVASEVPSGDPNFPNVVPGSNSLPPSFYLSAKPSFFGATPWPPIGPDVTGGPDSSVGGHVYTIPARACYEKSAKLNGVLTAFNAANCYPNYSSSPALASPTNVQATVK